MLDRLKHVASIAGAALALAALATGTALANTGASPLTVGDYTAILANPGRSEADRTDDAARKPAEVLGFAQLRPGETVLELQAGRGWYSEIISAAVGPSGKLIIQRPPQLANSAPVLQARVDAGRLKNATVTVTTFDKLEVPDNSVDKVLWFLGPHELYFTPRNAEPGALGDVQKTYAEIKRVLKPGGTFVVLDHAANAGAPTSLVQTIHRVDPAIVLAAAKAAGLTFVEKRDVLANPNDDRTKAAFDATIRRRTDQFLFRFRK